MFTRVRRLAGGLLRRLGGDRSATLRLTFATPEDFASFLDDPRARTVHRSFELTVTGWRPARPDWTGRLGPLPGVRTVTASFDDASGTARLSLTTAEPVPAAELVRAAYPLFHPVRHTTGWGGQRIGVHPGAPADQRWEPGGGLRPLLPKKLKRRRLTEYEYLIDTTGEYWLGDLDGPPQLVERPAAPAVLIDPKVHRPLDRRQPRHDTLSATARVAGDRLLVAAGGAGLLDVPLAAPLTVADLRRLALVTDIELSGLGCGDAVSRRVAELAAYGAVLHGAPDGLALTPALTDLITTPYGQAPLLDWANRSLHQVRAVMHGHTRVLAIGRTPSVSVLLSTSRPALLDRILEQLAAQDHPEVEVVIGCHGFDAPLRESFPEHLRARIGPILAFDGSVLFGDVLAALSAAASGDLLAKVDDDDLYGPHHLSDLVMAWHYSEAQLVGRKLALVHFEEDDTLAVRRFFLEGYRWDAAGGGSVIARGDLAAIGGWRSQRRAVDHGLMTRIADAGGLVYTCSGPGYIHVRHTAGHTWEVDEARFREKYVEATLQGIPKAAYGVL